MLGHKDYLSVETDVTHFEKHEAFTEGKSNEWIGSKSFMT